MPFPFALTDWKCEKVFYRPFATIIQGEKMSVPFLVPKPHQAVPEGTRRPSALPVDVYIDHLGIGSRRGMKDGLDTVATFLLGRPADANDVDWPSIRYNQTAAVRNWLLTRYRPATCKRILAAIRGVLKECWRLGLMSHDDCQRASDIASIRTEDEPRGRALTNEELKKLFDACAADTSIAGIRDTALLSVLYGIGLRRSELVGLNFRDYDAVEGTLSIDGKGGKPRIGFVLENVKVAMNAWVNARGDWEGTLFVPFVRGMKLSYRRMSDDGLALIVRKRGEQAGVEHFSLHDLRRTFITDLLSAGADLSVVQKLAGHRNISTTLIYDRRGDEAKVKAAKLLAIPK
ncbi:MAG TPA: tyrosine-type recombinase/integrase [Clostridia bacterium]|nr:tyrosine-type recombinase/integrase [Clostridia bacterium]